MFPTGMLDTPTQRKILRVLAEKNRMYSSSELADICHRSESSISRALSKADRFDFLKRKNVSGSRELAYGLDSSSRYSSVLREFFEVERQQERKDTVPLKVWNFLEDVISKIQNEDLLDVLLFGSYAEGNYYAGSDIDLLVIHEKNPEAVQKLRDIVDSHMYSKEVQIVDLGVEPDTEDLIEEVHSKSPVSSRDAAISLTGELDL
ncbi:MAG: nucleotidyltransferase domain-containing protein [Candidatus Nanohalobium sp.]